MGIDQEAAGPVILLEPGDVFEIRPVHPRDGHRLAECEPDLNCVTFLEIFPGDLVFGVCARCQVVADERPDSLGRAIAG